MSRLLLKLLFLEKRMSFRVPTRGGVVESRKGSLIRIIVSLVTHFTTGYLY